MKSKKIMRFGFVFALLWLVAAGTFLTDEYFSVRKGRTIVLPTRETIFMEHKSRFFRAEGLPSNSPQRHVSVNWEPLLLTLFGPTIAGVLIGLGMGLLRGPSVSRGTNKDGTKP